MFLKVFNMEEKAIPVKAIIDNKSTVDAVLFTASVSDKKLRRDIGIVKQILNEGDVTSGEDTWQTFRERNSR